MTNFLTVQSSTVDLKAEQVVSFLTDNFAQIIEQFDCHAKTRAKYISDVKSFIDFVKMEGLNLNTFRQYKRHLEGLTGISAKTKAVKMTAAKRLLQELHSRYRILAVDLTAGTRNFKTNTEHVKDGLSASEVAKVKAVILKEADDFKRLRLLAMFNLLALQGLRQFEVTALTVEDLRLDDGQALVKGKGRDDREIIDLHPETVKALRLYLLTTGQRSGHLFTSISRAAKTRTALTERGVRKLFGQLFAAAGLPEGRSVHGLRHYFVTRILEVTSGDLLTVQKFSRHKSLNAVKCYDDRQRKKDLLPVYYQAFA